LTRLGKSRQSSTSCSPVESAAPADPSPVIGLRPLSSSAGGDALAGVVERFVAALVAPPSRPLAIVRAADGPIGGDFWLGIVPPGLDSEAPCAAAAARARGAAAGPSAALERLSDPRDVEAAVRAAEIKLAGTGEGGGGGGDDDGRPLSRKKTESEEEAAAAPEPPRKGKNRPIEDGYGTHGSSPCCLGPCCWRERGWPFREAPASSRWKNRVAMLLRAGELSLTEGRRGGAAAALPAGAPPPPLLARSSLSGILVRARQRGCVAGALSAARQWTRGSGEDGVPF
jgi:hypothetical protein